MALINFYGKECPHCLAMHAFVDQLEKEEGIVIEKKEVWHDDENMKVMETHDKDLCGGVPFFINTETGKFICGETNYEALKAWATGK
jgi:hypothetical protein